MPWNPYRVDILLLFFTVFYNVLRLIKMAENIVSKELQNNPFSLCPLHDTLGRVNKGWSTVLIPSLITHHKTKTENIEDIFVSLSMKSLTV
jgi:hypothetical protein